MTCHCTGPCQQGRIRCVAPQACECEDSDGLPGAAFCWTLVVAVLAVVAAASVVIARWL